MKTTENTQNTNSETVKRTFEIYINRNYNEMAYTLEVKNAKEARNYAITEAKMNNNSTIDILEIGGNNYTSGTIIIK